MTKKILLRLNAGKKFGMGHLSRNLVLAKAFSDKNFQCNFLIKTDDENKVLSFLKSRNSTPKRLIFLSEEMNIEKDIGEILKWYDIGKSFLILDHYEHDLCYQKELKRAGIHWAQFDYKREDRIIADIVINPNVGVKASDYLGLVGGNTKLCVGERFAIIGGDFKKIKVKPQPDRILIAMGGGSYPQEVIDMITALVSDKNYRFDVVTMSNELGEKFKKNTNVEIHENPEKIADIYARNCVAVVAGGVTTYELAYLNIPMLIVPFTDNQKENARKWQEYNYSIGFKNPRHFRSYVMNGCLSQILRELGSNFSKRDKIIDGMGTLRIRNCIDKILA